MRTIALVGISLVALALAGACSPSALECASAIDCGEAREAPPCERCPAPTTAFCVASACVERGDDAVDVSASFLIARALDGVNGMAWVLAVADRDCEAVLGALSSPPAFPLDLNVLASGQKTLSGGDLHEDVALAPVPEGAVLLIALATSGAAGEGDVLGRGCAVATAAPPALAVAQVDLE